jgi:hypothetical protein
MAEQGIGKNGKIGMAAPAEGLIQGAIGRAELFSLALSLCLGGVMLFGAAEKSALHDVWLLIPAAAVLGLVYPLLFRCWLELFAGQSFAASLQYALGRVFGRIVLFLYALFWLALTEVAAAYIVDFWAALGVDGTPLLLYAAIFLAVAAAFAGTGLVSLAWVALLVVVPALLLVLGNFLLTVLGADLGNLLPLQAPKFGVDGEVGEFLLLAAECALLVFGNLTTLLPALYHTEAAKLRVGVLGGAMLSAALVLLAAALSLMVVLGETLPLYDFPILQAFRLAEVGHWFSRFEVIGVALLVMLGTLRAAALFSAAASSLCELWGWDMQNYADYAQNNKIKWLLILGLAALLMCGMPWSVQQFRGGFGALSDLLIGCIIGGMAIFSLVLPWLVIVLAAWRLRREGRNIIIRHEE